MALNSMNISVVLPILNEGQIIHKTIVRLVAKMEKTASKFEVLAVNDGSTDNTRNVLEKLHSKDTRIKVINHKGNKGYGAALKTGVRKAKFDWIFFMDSDLQFDVAEIKKFIPYHADYDFIIGYREGRADPLKRIYISKMYNYIVSFLFDIHITDIDCAFKLMRKSAIQQLGVLPNSFFVSTTLLVKAVRAKMRLKEIPVKHLPRTKGVSTVTLHQVMRTIRDLFIMYFKLNILPVRYHSTRYSRAQIK
jgi:glycosyltransferase involved in cell wall biosynthesis